MFFKKYGPGVATLVLLVQHGLKPAGEVELGSDEEAYNVLASDLEDAGLGCYLNRRDAHRRCAAGGEFASLRHYLEAMQLRYDATASPANGFHDVVVHDVPSQLIFWRGSPCLSPEDAALAYNNGKHETFGRFMGYPPCCIEQFNEARSVARYHAELQARFGCSGLSGIERLVGIQHIPHSIDCEATAKLGYSAFLRDNAPDLYAFEAAALLGRCQPTGTGTALGP